MHEMMSSDLVKQRREELLRAETLLNEGLSLVGDNASASCSMA